MAVIAGDILETKRRRLAKLEQQAAQFGYDTPPHLANEIEDLQREIARGGMPSTVAESHTILFGLLMETRTDVRRMYWLLPLIMLFFCGLLILLVKL